MCHVTLLSLHPVRTRTRTYEPVSARVPLVPSFIAHACVHTYVRARTSTAPPRIPDVTTLAHLARRTLEMSPPPLFLLLLYFSLSLSLPPFVAAVLSLSLFLPPSLSSLRRDRILLGTREPPLLNRALFTLVVPATAERGAARSCVASYSRRVSCTASDSR